MAKTHINISGSIRKNNPGHVDWYFGGGNDAWDSIQDALNGIPATPSPDMRRGRKFGVWEPDSNGDLVIKIYQWKNKDKLGDGDYEEVGTGGGSASIDDTAPFPDKTYSSEKVETLFDNTVNKETGKGLSSNDFTDAYKQKVDQFSLIFLGKFTDLAALKAKHPVVTAEAGQFGYVNEYDGSNNIIGEVQYKFNAVLGDYELTPDAVTNFIEEDITVKLTNGKTFGKYLNGQTARLQGLSFTAALKDIAIEEIFPKYTSPSLTINTNLNPNNIEIGETISPSIIFAFTQNDAGPVLNSRLYRVEPDSTESLITENTQGMIGPSPIQEPVGQVAQVAPLTYRIEVSHDEGDPKYGDAGTEAPGLIQANTMIKTTQLRGYKKIFYGATAGQLLDVSDFANLTPRFTSYNINGFTYNVPANLLYVYVAIPVELDFVRYDDPNYTNPADTTLPNGDYVEITAQGGRLGSTLTYSHPDGSTSEYKVYEKAMASPYNSPIPHTYYIQ